MDALGTEPLETAVDRPNQYGANILQLEDPNVRSMEDISKGSQHAETMNFDIQLPKMEKERERISGEFSIQLPRVASQNVPSECADLQLHIPTKPHMAHDREVSVQSMPEQDGETDKGCDDSGNKPQPEEDIDHQWPKLGGEKLRYDVLENYPQRRPGSLLYFIQTVCR